MLQQTKTIYTDNKNNNNKNNVSYWLEKLFNQEDNMNDKSPVLTNNNSYQTKNLILREEGKNEQTRYEATKNEKDRKTINDLVRKSNRCIITISSLFPWEFFPNTIQVEESRVTFIFRQFLASQSHSVDIKDISNVFIESSWNFSTLQVVSRTYIQNDIKIGHLNTKKAIEVRMIIEGLRTFVENNIDTSNYEVSELISKIYEFHTNQIST